MKIPIPPITEEAEALKQLLHSEKLPQRKQRLHALYLLKTGQAKNRIQTASLLNVNRNTVGRWLVAYKKGGLQALLDVYIPSGKKSSLSEEALLALKQKLSQEKESFSSYKTAWLWFREHYRPSYSYTGFHELVHDKLKAKLKVPRKSHKKKMRKKFNTLKKPFQSEFRRIC